VGREAADDQGNIMKHVAVRLVAAVFTILGTENIRELKSRK